MVRHNYLRDSGHSGFFCRRHHFNDIPLSSVQYETQRPYEGRNPFKRKRPPTEQSPSGYYMRAIILVAPCFLVLNSCTSSPPYQGPTVADYQKDMEDQLGITRARTTSGLPRTAYPRRWNDGNSGCCFMLGAAGPRGGGNDRSGETGGLGLSRRLCLSHRRSGH
jgi:hypothetical protein